MDVDVCTYVCLGVLRNLCEWHDFLFVHIQSLLWHFAVVMCFFFQFIVIICGKAHWVALLMKCALVWFDLICSQRLTINGAVIDFVLVLFLSWMILHPCNSSKTVTGQPFYNNIEGQDQQSGEEVKKVTCIHEVLILLKALMYCSCRVELTWCIFQPFNHLFNVRVMIQSFMVQK